MFNVGVYLPDLPHIQAWSAELKFGADLLSVTSSNIGYLCYLFWVVVVDVICVVVVGLFYYIPLLHTLYLPRC